MKAAVLNETGTVPAYADFPDPEPGARQVVVDVTAAGVHHLDLTRASGAYGAPATLPYVIGADGVGRTSDRRRVFFTEPVSPHGSWAQRVLVPEGNLLDLADGVDDVTAAALGNTGLAAWLALTWRANLQPGETVLVLGATGALGSVAVQIAKALGASVVVAADRNADRLARAAAHGADATVTITPDVDLADAFRQAAGGRCFDVIIDPLWVNPPWPPCTPPPSGPGTSRSASPPAPPSSCPLTSSAEPASRSSDSPTSTRPRRPAARPT